jgi:hypothetical protein
MIPSNNSSRQERGKRYTEQDLVSKWGVPRPKSIFSSKTP